MLLIFHNQGRCLLCGVFQFFFLNKRKSGKILTACICGRDPGKLSKSERIFIDTVHQFMDSALCFEFLKTF